MEGIGRFLGIYHISQWDDARPIVHAPKKCPIAMIPLVCVKHDGFLEQGIIIPVTEPTDWVSVIGLLMEGKWKTQSLPGP